MKAGLVILFMLITWLGNSQSMQFQWAQNVGGINSGDDEEISGIVNDKSGNCYAVGHFEHTIYFGDPNDMDTLQYGGFDDGFIIKYNRHGSLIWKRHLYGNHRVYAQDVDIDIHGNIYVCGNYSDTLNANVGGPGFKLYDGGMFVMKLDSLGNILWLNALEGGSNNNAAQIKVLAGSVIIGGAFQNTVDFDPGPNVYNETSQGSNDIFVLRLDIAGNFQWVKTMGGSGQDVLEGLAINANGKIAGTGWYRETADFDPGPGTLFHTPVQAGVDDIFLFSLDSFGDLEFAHSFGDIDYDEGMSVAIDNDLNVYVGGQFEGSVDLDPSANTNYVTSSGDWDAFLAKYDQNGDFVWARSYGEADNDRVFEIETDTVGYIYITGSYEGTVNWNPTGTPYLSTSFGTDSYILKLDEQGLYTSFYSLNSTSLVRGEVISVDDYQGIWSGGYLNNVTDIIGDLVVDSILDPVTSQHYVLHINQCMYHPSISLTGNVLSVNQNFDNIQWYDCDNDMVIPGETGANFEPTTSGNYAAIVNYSTCTDTSSCLGVTVSSVGIGENELAELSCYPNPAINQLIVDLTKVSAKGLLKIYDVNGSIVYHADVDNSNKHHISLNSLRAGLFIVEMQTSENVYRTQFIKY